jgi:hypothetical protein
MDKYYGEEGSEDVNKILAELGGDEKITEEATVAAETDDEDLLASLANEAPIVRFVNLVLFQAVKDRASDIHFEPFETEFRIRYRVDGALYEMSPPPKHLALPVVSRIKVMANLNISERRFPQDGRINYKLGHKEIDLRVSTLPTQFGESVVLRVLDRSSVNLELESLGFPKSVYDFVSEVILRPNGIFVVTGPTGCGKTTTLYSCLRRVNAIDSKLLDRRRSGGIRHRRHHAGGDQRSCWHDLRQGVALLPAARPGHHHGRGNARLGNGADCDSSLADRPLGAEHVAHERRARRRDSSGGHGHRALPGVLDA